MSAKQRVQAAPRVQLLKEQPHMFGHFFQLDYKLGWLAGLGGTAFVLFFLLVIINKPELGVTILVLTALFLLAVVWSGVLHRAYKRWSKRFVRFTGRDRYKSGQPEVGTLTSVDGRSKPPSDRSYDRMLGNIRLRAINLPEDETNEDDAESTEEEETPPESKLGVVEDREYGTLSAVLSAHGSSLLGIDPHYRVSQLEAWERVMKLVVDMGPAVNRLVWQVQTLPRQPQDPEGLLDAVRRDARLGFETRAGEELFSSRLKEMGEQSVVHLTRIVLSIDRSKLKSNWGKRKTVADETLVDLMRTLYDATSGQGPHTLNLRGATFYSLGDLWWHTRQVLDPVFMDELRGRKDIQHELSAQIARPKSNDWTNDGYCRVGSTYHVGYHMNTTLRKGVNEETFWKIQSLGIPKTLTTVVQPLSPQWAQKTAEFRAGGAESANQELHDKSRRVSAVRELQEQDAAARERELAAEESFDLRVQHYFDAQGTSPKQALDNANQILQVARNGGIVLEPLIGQQHLGIEALQFAGRGLAAYKPSEFVEKLVD